MNEITHGDNAKPRIKFQEHRDLKVGYKVYLEIAAKEKRKNRGSEQAACSLPTHWDPAVLLHVH